jgi:solute carrier family 13 (sodium-dependent dicarboxylate transporter), member 2/3/5
LTANQSRLSKQQRKFISLLAGVVIALLLYFINPFNVPEAASRVLAVAALMITWWVAEAMPMPVVALIPLILFPLLKISSIEDTAKTYSNEVIFLFMGGFMLGLAIEKWNLHRRIALNIVRMTGTSGNGIVLGFILATGFLSMWLSNTATTMMMFPIALSVIHVMKENPQEKSNYNNFNLCLMLAIAWASNFGGIATIIGTPPNVQFVGFFEKQYKTNIDFTEWMLLCTPLALLLMLALYIVSTRVLFPNHIKSSGVAKKHIQGELLLLGKFSAAEKRVLIIFICTALLWILKSIINKSQSLFKLDDNMIAIIGAVALFICPSGSTKKEDDGKALLEWDDTKKMAWGILLLFGGGLALADALKNAGLIQQLGGWLGQYAGGGFVLVLVVTVLSIFLSEMMSNVAQVIVFSPVIFSLADSIGMNPLLLGIPMTLAASCACMLPMGTPPNAIAFSSGHIKLKDMIKAGLVMNLVAIALISLFCWYLLPVLIHTK